MPYINSTIAHRRNRSARKPRSILRRLFTGLLSGALATQSLVGVACAQSSKVPTTDEPVLESPIVSIGLFKNGLAVVRREMTFDKPGTYRLETPIAPVHGTLKLEGAASEVMMDVRERKVITTSPLGVDLNRELGGMKVVLNLKRGDSPVSGTIVVTPAPRDSTTSELLSSLSSATPPQPTGRFLVVKTDRGIAYIDSSDIASLFVEGNPEVEKKETTQQENVFLVKCTNASGGKGSMSYLAHGISWAPSYTVNLLSNKELTLQQHAVIRNEYEDLNDVPLSVISGYPNVPLANVTSPLAIGQSWASFFQNLSNPNSFMAFGNNRMMMQNAAYAMNSAPSQAVAVAPNPGDTLDLKYRDIGRHSLKKNAAEFLSLSKGKCNYEPIVEWTIPDNRDEWGNPVHNAQQVDPATGQVIQDDIWDALTFANPLEFALTTGPAMVEAGGMFQGQGQLNWTNIGEQTTLRVNKALSIRARHLEYEKQVNPVEAAPREVLTMAGRRFNRVQLAAELRLCNHRATPVKLKARRLFSGELIKAEGDPTLQLREEGAWSVNKRNELNWTITLEPGKDEIIRFQYSVLVPF